MERGIRVRVAGRLNGAEIARQGTFKEGQIPLHTLGKDWASLMLKLFLKGIIGIKFGSIMINKGIIKCYHLKRVNIESLQRQFKRYV